MIPVTQTKFVIKDKDGKVFSNGNCWAAAIASLLELPITEVPNFEVWFKWNDGFYFDLTDRFLNLMGYKMDNAYEFRVFHPDIIIADGDTQYDIAEWQEKLTDKYYLCSGPSPRPGVHHVTIWQNGKMVFDPYPTREGILSIDNFQQITPLNEDELERVKYHINKKQVDFPSVF